jgi:hypothetical protein
MYGALDGALREEANPVIAARVEMAGKSEAWDWALK